MTDRTLRDIHALAKAFHDGPLGEGDYEFDPDTRQGKWCIEVVEFFEAALLDAHPAPPAIADAPVSDRPGPDVVAEAWRDVLAERQRQISEEGWTPEHDDAHTKRELAAAATCYASVYPLAASYWPWDLEWWKPTDHRRNLVKAGALILAEIERLDRAAKGQQP